MKRFAAIAVNVLLVCVFSTLGGYIAQTWPAEFAPPRHIHAESITLTAPGTDRAISMSVSSYQAGIWLRGEKGRYATMIDTGGFVAFGLYSDHRAHNIHGFDLAMAATSADGSFIQFIDPKNDKVSYLSKGDE